MKEIVKKEWVELPSVWNELIQKNPFATPFQSYAYLTLTGKGKPLRSDMFRILGVKELNLVLYADHVPVAIAPLLVKTKQGKTTVYFRGHFTAACQLDFIYADLSYDDFKFLMDGVRELLGDISFFLDRVYSKSPTSGYLKQYLASAEIQEHEGYAMLIPEHYDDWYKGLHKSQRQKLNNTNNRLAKDNVACTTRLYIGEKIDAAVYRRMIFVYVDRFLVKNNVRFGPFQYIVKKALQFYLLRDKMSRFLNIAGNSFHVIVYMNQEIAAFVSGLLCKNKRILCSRLAIDIKYGRYNPGTVLLSSAIRYLAEEKEANKTDIELMDMGQGCQGGMAYKTTYCGEAYINYTFIE